MSGTAGRPGRESLRACAACGLIQIVPDVERMLVGPAPAAPTVSAPPAQATPTSARSAPAGSARPGLEPPDVTHHESSARPHGESPASPAGRLLRGDLGPEALPTDPAWPLDRRVIALCSRCGTPFPPASDALRHRARTAACALAALILFPLAVWLPVLHLERFGHIHETGILRGCLDLWVDGHVGLATVVFACSFVFPLAKLIGLVVVAGRFLPMSPHRRAASFRLIELVGRWGMLDVLLVAILVAAVKLGNLLEVKPEEGAALFTLCVGLSLAASAFYDPHSIWQEDPPSAAR